MIRFLFLSFIIFFLLVGKLHGQKAEFFKEEITFAIRDNFFYVNGVYFLKADKTLELPLIYPFPIDSLYGSVDSVIILDQSKNLIIDGFRKTVSGILFSVHLDSLQPTELWISYRQKLNGRQAEYILLSTIAWKKPLQEASYRLLIPIEMEILNFSIEPDTFSIHGDTKIYHWEKSNFLPDRNMVFQF